MKRTSQSKGVSPLKVALEEEGRKMNWLAKSTGIDYQRLQRITNQGYEPTITEAAKISNSMRRPLLDLFPSTDLAHALQRDSSNSMPPGRKQGGRPRGSRKS